MFKNSARAYVVSPAAQNYDNGYSRLMLQCELQRLDSILRFTCYRQDVSLHVHVSYRSFYKQRNSNSPRALPFHVKIKTFNPTQQLGEKIAHQETQKLVMMPIPWCSWLQP